MRHVDEIRHDIVFSRRRRRCCSLFRGDDAPLLHLDLWATPLTHLNLCSPSHVAGQQSHADARDIYRPFYSQVLAEVQKCRCRATRSRDFLVVIVFNSNKRSGGRRRRGWSKMPEKWQSMGGKRAWFTPSNVNIPSK